MALIHEDLYRSADLRSVDFGAYAKRLVGRIAGMFSSAARVAMGFVLDDVALSMEKAIPCGLILNELCTNAFKHAFPNNKNSPSVEERSPSGDGGPRLTIGLKKIEDSGVSLSVWDNGIGLPEGFDFRTTQTMGMQIVMTLVHQLRGSIWLEAGPGARFNIEFDVKD
jgi:two-component sensor histidine kinase